MEKQPSSRTCFLCGRENEVSPKLIWYSDQENRRVVSDFRIPEHFNGYPGVAHGGIVAAILDETAGRAVMLDGFDDNFMVTMKLEITYRRPTPTLKPLTVMGWISEHKGSYARVSAELSLADGTVTAECKAVVIRPTGEVKENINAVLKDWYVDPD